MQAAVPLAVRAEHVLREVPREIVTQDQEKEEVADITAAIPRTVRRDRETAAAVRQDRQMEAVL